MRHGLFAVAAAVLAAVVFGCQPARHSPVGFRLPEGDIERGKTAFVELECHACHPVRGVQDLPQPSRTPPVPVVLGGRVSEVRTDGYLVTSIIHPSHRLARYPKEQITAGGESLMPDYRRTMTVGQLVDVVAFLQSAYEVVPPRAMNY